MPGIEGLDTRALVRHIRTRGTMPGAVVNDGSPTGRALAMAAAGPDINTLDLVGEVTCGAPYTWVDGADPAWFPLASWRDVQPSAAGLHVVVLDLGVKRNTLRLLAARGCRVTVVPARTLAADVLDMAPDGVVLSNGPGDPARLTDVVAQVARLLGRVPLLGICLGHQPLGLALGGRAMAMAYDGDELAAHLERAVAAAPGKAVLIDAYLEDAVEVDVDAVCDGRRVVIGGILQHIQEAGVHSGDSAMVLPPFRVSAYHTSVIAEFTEQIGLALGVRGLLNAQFAIKDDVVYVLEVNPRASRTVPFVAKATGVPLARVAAQVAAGRTLEEVGLLAAPRVDGLFVKSVVLPFDKLPGAAIELGPEMRSTGDVMGHAASFGHASAKAALAAGERLPEGGTVLLTVNDFDKAAAAKIARDCHRLGFRLAATAGTAQWLAHVGLPVTAVNKVSEGSPHVVDLIAAGAVDLVVSTPLGSTARADGQAIRAAAVAHRVPLLTTLSAAAAAVVGIRALRERALGVRSLQEHHGAAAGRGAWSAYAPRERAPTDRP